MKHLIKTIFGLSIAALLTVFISCPQPAGPGGAANSGSPSSPPTPQTPVEKALGELTVSPVQVYKDMNKVNLPTATSVTDVTISWTAEPAGYINDEESNPDFGNVLKRETETTEVTLTATATKDGEVKTKTFKITIHPATVEPDAQALAAGLTIQPAVSADFTLPKTVSGYSAAEITWESADDKIIKIESGSDIKGVVIGCDLIDRTVKLTAQVTYNGGRAKKTFNVTVKHIEEIKEENTDQNEIITHTFIGSEYTITHTDKTTGKTKQGTKYTYTDVQTAADGTKTAVFTKTAKYDEHEKKWVTKAEEIQSIRQFCDTTKSELAKLKKKNSLTLLDFQTLPGLAPASTREQIFEDLKWFPDANNPLKTYTFKTFDALNDEQESDELKKMLPIIENFIAQVIQEEIALVEQEFKPSKYRYEFYKSGAPGNEKIDFRANALYDPAKQWYEQHGRYEFNNPSAAAGEIVSMDLSVRERESNQYETRINIFISDGTNPSKGYDGKAGYTPGQTEITATLQEGGAPGPDITVKISNISVSPAGTMTANVKIDTGSPLPLTLQFEGYFLH